MKLNDQRAFVSASLINTTRDSIDKLAWVRTTLSSGLGNVSFRGIRFWSPTETLYEDGPCTGGYSYIGPPETWVDKTPESNPDIVWGQPNSWESSADDPLHNSYARVHIVAGIVGFPEAFKFFADDCTIKEAWCNITCISSYLQRDVVVTPPTYDEDITTEIPEMNYVVFAVSRSNDITVIGNVSGTPDGRTDLVNITDVVQAMWARKRDGETVGFAIVPGFAAAALMGDAWAFVDSLKPPITRSYFFPEGSTCPEWYESSYTFRSFAWGTPQLSNLRIKVDYPDYDSRDVVTPRWPVMD